jgi:hypothetical protein
MHSRSAAQLNKIYAGSLEPLGHLTRLLLVEATFREIGRVDLDREDDWQQTGRQENELEVHEGVSQLGSVTRSLIASMISKTIRERLSRFAPP